MLYQGLSESARARLEMRDYSSATVAERLATSGVMVSEIYEHDSIKDWIPGVEVFPRKVYQQLQRGYFAEFARQEEGIPAKIGLWPKQWAAAVMYSGTAKGFHIHPPHIPEEHTAPEWFAKLFESDPVDYSLRAYDKEQWDMMFVISGNAEIFFVDERDGMKRNKMRFVVEGDDQPGENNAGFIIPPGVAHAMRPASSSDVTMIYGTSTAFNPDFEGRINSQVEDVVMPSEWEEYFG